MQAFLGAALLATVALFVPASAAPAAPASAQASAKASTASGDVCDPARDEARNFVVHLKGGEVLSGRSSLCREAQASGPAMRLKIDGRTVYPFHTDSVFEEGVRGVPAPGSASWAFPIFEGRIRVFAARPGRGLKDATALSKDSEPMVRYSLAALEDRMRDSPKAQVLVQSKRKAGLTAGIMAVSGVTLMFVGILTGMEEVPDPDAGYQDTKTEFHPNVLFFAGIGMVLGSWFVPALATDNNPEFALRQYNAAFAAKPEAAPPAADGKP